MSGEAGTDRLEIDNMFLCGSTLTRVSLKGSTFKDAHINDILVSDLLAAHAAKTT